MADKTANYEEIKHETASAYLIKFHDDATLWMPKS